MNAQATNEPWMYNSNTTPQLNGSGISYGNRHNAGGHQHTVAPNTATKVAQKQQPKASPRRMFLGEVPQFIQQSAQHNINDNSVNISVRLMGRVIGRLESSPQTSSLKRKRDEDAPSDSMTNTPHNTQQYEPIVNFTIDDGTAAIDVYIKREPVPSTAQQSIIPPPYTASAMQQQKANSSLSFPNVKIGQLVDCIGQIKVDTTTSKGEKSSAASNDISKQQHPTQQHIWLETTSVSIINNPQEETLRQLELCSTITSHLNQNINTRTNATHGGYTQNHQYTGRKPPDDSHIPKNRILVAGDLALKLNPLYHYNQNNIQCVLFNTDSAFGYIRYSKDYGGLSCRDLEVLVGAIKPNDRRAVRVALEELQSQGMVYMKEGKYFPL